MMDIEFECQAAAFKFWTDFSEPPIWFQLAKFRLTSVRSRFPRRLSAGAGTRSDAAFAVYTLSEKQSPAAQPRIVVANCATR